MEITLFLNICNYEHHTAFLHTATNSFFVLFQGFHRQNISQMFALKL